MKILIFVGIFVLTLVLTASYYLKNSDDGSRPPTLLIGDRTISIEIADTEIERRAGLSGKLSLPTNEGLLFIFDVLGKHGIWMKDMKFSIDILWLDENYIVIDIAKNISPDTYPLVFGSSAPALYVLEVNAGVSENYGINVGDKFIYE